ncbi:outer membrane beta-barrel protein [Spirosoma agri]
MKVLLLVLALIVGPISPLAAQSRVSIAPTYWFNYNPYSYQLAIIGSVSTTRSQVSQYNLVSSLGLTARYHFNPHWEVSTGVFHYSNKAYIDIPSVGSVPFSSSGWQVPILLNYRLTAYRVSPYFSAGALFAKSKTFTEAPVRTDAVIGVGVDYQFTSSLSLLIQPMASHSFERPVDEATFQYSNYRSYSLGVQTQLVWHF